MFLAESLNMTIHQSDIDHRTSAVAGIVVAFTVAAPVRIGGFSRSEVPLDVSKVKDSRLPLHARGIEVTVFLP